MTLRTLVTLTLISSAAMADAGVAPGDACEQRVQTGAGYSLWFSRAESLFVLNFMGPMESDVGRYWPMKVRRSGKVVTVTIAPRSVPSSGPGGPTLPAGGSNPGAVSLPALTAGTYELVVRQGKLQSRFSLEVTDDLRVTPIGKVDDSLAFPSELWRHTPADAGVVHCQPVTGCGAPVCNRFMSQSAVVRVAPKVEDGWYFTLQSGEWSCAVMLPLDAGALQRELSSFDDAGCARFVWH